MTSCGRCLNIENSFLLGNEQYPLFVGLWEVIGRANVGG